MENEIHMHDNSPTWVSVAVSDNESKSTVTETDSTTLQGRDHRQGMVGVKGELHAHHPSDTLPNRYVPGMCKYYSSMVDAWFTCYP